MENDEFLLESRRKRKKQSSFSSDDNIGHTQENTDPSSNLLQPKAENVLNLCVKPQHVRTSSLTLPQSQVTSQPDCSSIQDPNLLIAKSSHLIIKENNSNCSSSTLNLKNNASPTPDSMSNHPDCSSKDAASTKSTAHSNSSNKPGLSGTCASAPPHMDASCIASPPETTISAPPSQPQICSIVPSHKDPVRTEITSQNHNESNSVLQPPQRCSPTANKTPSTPSSISSFSSNANNSPLTPASSSSPSNSSTPLARRCLLEDTFLDNDYVENLLKKSVDGKILLKFKDCGRLANEKRGLLSKILMTEELRPDPSKLVAPERFEAISTAICELFQKESRFTYYIPFCKEADGTVHPCKGKLYDTYCKLRRKYIQAGVITGKKRRSSTQPPPTNGTELLAF